MNASATPAVGDTVAKVNGEIDVGEDLSFQRRWWRFERWAWVAFTLIILLDLSGAFGRGPLAYGHLQSADQSLKVEYERIERTGTPAMMDITLDSATMTDGHLTLSVSDPVFSGLGAQRIVPQPAESRIGKQGITYLFLTKDAPAIVRLELTPPHAGVFSFALQTKNGASVVGKVWVVP